MAALTKDGDRALTQAWARHFYMDESSYGPVDDLLYENAHNAAQAVALFERAGTLQVVEDWPLGAIADQLFCIADALGLKVE